MLILIGCSTKVSEFVKTKQILAGIKQRLCVIKIEKRNRDVSLSKMGIKGPCKRNTFGRFVYTIYYYRQIVLFAFIRKMFDLHWVSCFWSSVPTLEDILIDFDIDYLLLALLPQYGRITLIFFEVFLLWRVLFSFLSRWILSCYIAKTSF